MATKATNKDVRRVSDIVPQVDWSGFEPLGSVEGDEILINEVEFHSGGKFEGEQVKIFAASSTGESLTLKTSSAVVITKLHKIDDEGAFPVLALVEHKKGDKFNYYDIT